MTEEMPGLQRLITETGAAVMKGLQALDTESLESLDRLPRFESIAPFLRIADPNRTAELILKVLRARMGPVDSNDQADEREKRYDAIDLHVWQSGLNDGSADALASMLDNVRHGLSTTARAHFLRLSPEEVGAIFADLWRMSAGEPGSDNSTDPNAGLTMKSWHSLRDVLAPMVVNVVVRHLAAQQGRDITLAWAEATIRLPKQDS